uniref:Uncharacterized protein n=1 Tax=Neogobius melanostomus TaxID=47308 RepID=A0A8C6SYJ7_9GOBI
MEALKLLVVFLLMVLFQVMGVVSGPLSNKEQDSGVWTLDTWQEFPLERGLRMRLAEIIKRSKAQQFHGLMGRSSGISHSARLGRKRNKGEAFVGLMGKRSLGEEDEWDMY